VDAVRRFNDAFNGRDLAALLSSCDPDIEVASGRVLMGSPTYRGQSGMEPKGRFPKEISGCINLIDVVTPF